ncbi:hypothetical protein ICE98_00637 [Lactococcus lactis]|nr:hypothetical protein [Lactococcus lactis]
MREAGIEVSLNVLEKECKDLNKIFFITSLKEPPMS